MSPFRVGVTSDFRRDALIGRSAPGAIESALDGVAGLEWEYFDAGEEVTPGSLAGYDAVVAGMPAFTRASFAADGRLVLVASWGIGVDDIDLAAAREHGVLVANAPTRANVTAVAESALTLVLALSKRLLEKHRLTVAGAATEAQSMMGGLVEGRVVGTVGLGRTARGFVRRLAPLGPARILAYDPYVDAAEADALGVEPVDLDTLMGAADFVVVMCTLNDETRGLVGDAELRRMHPGSCVVNVARGPIVDQRALTAALQEGRVAAAGLDVFELEPPPADEPLLALPNVIATGHAIAWTTETMVAACLEPCHAVLRLHGGGLPEHLVDRALLDSPDFAERLARRRAAWAS